MAWTSKDRPNRLGDKQNLCWSCDNAAGKCRWSRRPNTPVPGWDAEPDMFMSGKVYKPTYKIYDCPEFVRLIGSEGGYSECVK